MANRRMFAKSLTNSARFLRMPASAQLLYMHLGMNADDEGIAEGFCTMRMCGADESDLMLLQEKGFVKVLNDDLVTYIIDWDLNNQIKKDRKQDSIYHALLNDFLNDSTSETNDSEVGTKCSDDGSTSETNDSKVVPECIQDGDKAETNDSKVVPQVRLGKVSIGKDSIGKGSSSCSSGDEPPQLPSDPLVKMLSEELPGMSSPILMEKALSYRDELPDDVIIFGITESLSQGIRKWSYIESILDRCIAEGIDTLAKAKASKESFKNKKQSGAPPGKDHGYQEHEYKDGDLDHIFDLSRFGYGPTP